MCINGGPEICSATLDGVVTEEEGSVGNASLGAWARARLAMQALVHGPRMVVVVVRAHV